MDRARAPPRLRPNVPASIIQPPIAPSSKIRGGGMFEKGAVVPRKKPRTSDRPPVPLTGNWSLHAEKRNEPREIQFRVFGQVWISVGSFNSFPTIHIREYRTVNDTGVGNTRGNAQRQIPTATGVCLNPEELEDVISFGKEVRPAWQNNDRRSVSIEIGTRGRHILLVGDDIDASRPKQFRISLQRKVALPKNETDNATPDLGGGHLERRTLYTTFKGIFFVGRFFPEMHTGFQMLLFLLTVVGRMESSANLPSDGQKGRR